MLNIVLLILVIFVMTLIGNIISTKINSLLKKKSYIDFSDNNYSVKPLMTKYEKYFYNILVELEDELSVKIHPQVNLASILNKESNNYYINELFRNIDFAIFSKDYEKLILLIEINDSTHKSKDRIARDKKVDKILGKANVRLLKFYSDYPNKREYIKDRIKNEITKLK